MVFPSQNPSCAIVASILPHLLLPLYVNINVVSSDAQTVDRFVFSTHLDHLCLTSDAPNNGKTLSGCMFECFFWFPVFFVWISCSTLFLYQLHLYCIVWIAWLDFCISRLDFLFNSCSTLCWYKLICIVDRRHQFCWKLHWQHLHRTDHFIFALSLHSTDHTKLVPPLNPLHKCDHNAMALSCAKYYKIQLFLKSELKTDRPTCVDNVRDKYKMHLK